MDKICRKLLKQMNSVKPDPAEKLYDWHEDLEELARSIKSPTESARAAIRYLHDQGYVAYGKNQHGVALCFYLDHKGLIYKEQEHIERKAYLQEHFWLPFLVSFLSGVAADELIRLLLRLIDQL